MCVRAHARAELSPVWSPVAGWHGSLHGIVCQDIDAWDVSSLENLKDAFSRATAFNHGLSSWNVGNVKTLQRTFYDARKFNQDLSRVSTTPASVHLGQ